MTLSRQVKWLYNLYNNDILTNQTKNRIVHSDLRESRIFKDNDQNASINQLLNQVEELSSEREKLQHFVRHKKQRLDHVSHDMMSLMNAVSGYLDLMKNCLDSNAETDRISRYRSQINQGINDLIGIVEYLRGLNGLDDGEYPLDLYDVDLNRVVQEACDVMDGAALSKDHDLLCLVLPNPVFVNANQSQLKRILYNLIDNAIKFTPRGGNICVKLELDGSEAMVKIEDNGIGIPQKNLQNIFQSQNKVHATGTENEQGFGLGLYICARFAAIIDGWITFESIESEGSCFVLHLPLSKNQDVIDITSEQTERRPGRRTGRSYMDLDNYPGV